MLAQRLDLRASLLGTPAAADFFAFGYAYLQVELLTRSMHYDPLVKQESLRAAIVAAADAANGRRRAGAWLPSSRTPTTT